MEGGGADAGEGQVWGEDKQEQESESVVFQPEGSPKEEAGSK
jgi:hypothetical protein